MNFSIHQLPTSTSSSKLIRMRDLYFKLVHTFKKTNSVFLFLFSILNYNDCSELYYNFNKDTTILGQYYSQSNLQYVPHDMLHYCFSYYEILNYFSCYYSYFVCIFAIVGNAKKLQLLFSLA